ncbi:thiaminase II [Caldalkalibacillus salinus]|uniref:thiaminase II n=1 Tax=Caldalkalibacillus salinus TaxID=2803787 RepID=UPI001921851A|nr:thiaminase II [Caldalkalibacillus salinus]
MTFTDRLHQKVHPIWEANHQHPFVQEIGEGTLDVKKFRYFMIQDYLYLKDFAKLFALGAVKADDVRTMGEFAKLLDATLNVEMDVHRQYAKKFDITAEELEEAEPAAVTLAYSHYMLQVAQNGTLPELICALLPCMWSYSEIGKALSEIPGASEHEFYGEWVQMYASEEFGQLANWLIDELNLLTEGKPEQELAHLENIFVRTSKFEYMFWDMAYQEQTWPVSNEGLVTK